LSVEVKATVKQKAMEMDGQQPARLVSATSPDALVEGVEKALAEMSAKAWVRVVLDWGAEQTTATGTEMGTVSWEEVLDLATGQGTG
jgi:hypothetical protein